MQELRIAVFETDDLIRQLLHDRLTAAGCRVSAGNLVDAVARIEQLVIGDVGSSA